MKEHLRMIEIKKHMTPIQYIKQDNYEAILYDNGEILEKFNEYHSTLRTDTWKWTEWTKKELPKI